MIGLIFSNPHAFELASMVATIGHQIARPSPIVLLFATGYQLCYHADKPTWKADLMHDPNLVANLGHHADKPPWNATYLILHLDCD